MQRSTTLIRRTALTLMIVVVLASSSVSFFPQKTYALFGIGDIVFDPTNTIQDTFTAGATVATQIKNYALDPLAWAISKAVLQSVVNSTVKWINSGFKGSPAFATNLGSTLQSVGDSAANSFIQQLSTNGSIKSPFQNQVASAVSSSYFQGTASNGFFSQNAYTLNKVTPNDSAFLAGNFSQGGWDAWISTAMHSPNNPYGATMLAGNAVGSQVTTAQANQKTELNWGSGFMSQKNCPAAPKTSGSTALSTTATTAATCALGTIINPGSTIKTALDKSLGSGVDELVTANQFNEIVNALMGQLINQVLGSGGLSGVSQASPTTGGTTYFAQTPTTSDATVSSNLNSTFIQTINSQITQLQAFEAEWGTINSAAQNASSALQSNACGSNQITLTNTVQPVINQATTEIAQATASITALNAILNELPTSTSATNSSTQLQQASNDYSTLLASPTLPSASDISNAANQSLDTSGAPAGTTPSLFTQMNQIAKQAASCNT